jgi:anti-sigma-K factor RskA
MTREDPRLSGAFALDAVTDEERTDHERAVAADFALLEETTSLAAAAAELSRITEVTPPAQLRADVLAAIRHVRPLPPVTLAAPDAGPSGDTVPVHDDRGGTVVSLNPRRRRAATWISAVVAAAAAVAAVFVVLAQRGDGPSGTMADAVRSASDVSSFQQPVGDWSAVLYVSPSENRAVIVSETMPDAPSGNDFQVWLEMPGGQMISAGLMPRTGGKGQEFVVSGDIADADAVAISVEPEGGSPQPTSPPVVKIAV